MLKVLLFCLAFVVLLRDGEGHTYHLGACPNIDPMPGFTIKKMLGIWYVIQKTSTGSTCITYNITETGEPGQYLLEQKSQHFLIKLTSWKHNYLYKGHLSVPDEGVPARMKVKFPLTLGSAMYTVFMTDYDNYAGIFTCQKWGFAHRESATILSREKTLDQIYVDKIRSKLSSSNIDPFSLSIISQKDCPKPNATVTNITIDDKTFSPTSAGNLVKKAGEKIGDGVEYVAAGATNIYNKIVKTDENEEMRATNPYSEWLP